METNTPALAAHTDERNAVTTMAVGLFAPAVARMVIAISGRIWIEAVLSARKVTMALVAVPGRGLIASSRRMARRPSGVAALPRPSMFAAMFMTMAPIAGCSAGTSGKSRRSTGRSTPASASTSPERSASRMIPSQMAHTPSSGSATFITAFSAPVKPPSIICGSLPVRPATTTATMSMASQMIFSMAAEHAGARRRDARRACAGRWDRALRAWGISAP